MPDLALPGRFSGGLDPLRAPPPASPPRRRLREARIRPDLPELRDDPAGGNRLFRHVDGREHAVWPDGRRTRLGPSRDQLPKRIGLNVVSGEEFNIGMLFEGAKKLLPAVGAMILYVLMIAIGFLLLIAPGIYLAMLYGHCLTAMVDRNLGIMESFQYSSSISTNNRLNLFLLSLLGILITFAGCLALCVGLLFALPVIWLGWIVAYRWMQYGHRAALDHPGTMTPMLAIL